MSPVRTQNLGFLSSGVDPRPQSNLGIKGAPFLVQRGLQLARGPNP